MGMSWLPPKPGQPVKVSSVPYFERQAVIVVSDDEAEQQRKAFREASESDGKKLPSALLKLVGAGGAGAAAAGRASRFILVPASDTAGIATMVSAAATAARVAVLNMK